MPRSPTWFSLRSTLLAGLTADRVIPGCHLYSAAPWGPPWLLGPVTCTLNHLSWHSWPFQTDAKIAAFQFPPVINPPHTSSSIAEGGHNLCSSVPVTVLPLSPLLRVFLLPGVSTPLHLSKSYPPFRVQVSGPTSPRKPSVITPIRSASCSKHLEFLPCYSHVPPGGCPASAHFLYNPLHSSMSCAVKMMGYHPYDKVPNWVALSF